MKNNLIVFITILLFSLISCKKYEDGPVFSLRSKKARATNTWKIDELYINGTKQVLTEEDKKSRLTLRKDGSAFVMIVTDNSVYELNGSWSFENKKSVIEVEGPFNYGGIQFNQSIEFTILRLKENELWLKYENINPLTFQKETLETHYVPE